MSEVSSTRSGNNQAIVEHAEREERMKAKLATMYGDVSSTADARRRALDQLNAQKDHREHIPLTPEQKEVQKESTQREIVALRQEQAQEIHDLAKAINSQLSAGVLKGLKGRVTLPGAAPAA